MKSVLRLSSPAKLNFYLQVLGKRPDEFHEIVTLFQRISLADELTFRSIPKNNSIRIRCDHPHVPCGPKNLVYKVVEIIRQRFGISQGVDIEIKKNIPVAAGLAGGSTNAATTFLALNQLWNLNLSRKQLVDMGLEIGSDVPFFLYEVSWAWGTGRGGTITPLKLSLKTWQTVVVPKVKMYAKTVYQGLNSRLTKGGVDANILTYSLKRNDLDGVSKLLRNDLEAVVLNMRPSLKVLQQRLKSLGAKAVMVSGSGPAVFGLMSGQELAIQARDVLARRYCQVFSVQTL